MVKDHRPKNSDSHVLRKYYRSDEVHGLADPLLDPLLNVQLLLLGEISLGVATAGAVVGHGPASWAVVLGLGVQVGHVAVEVPAVTWLAITWPSSTGLSPPS